MATGAPAAPLQAPPVHRWATQCTHESYSPMSLSSSLRLLSRVSRSSPYEALPAPRSSPSPPELSRPATPFSAERASFDKVDGGVVVGGDCGGGGGGGGDRRRCCSCLVVCSRRLPCSEGAGRFRFFCLFSFFCPASPLAPAATPAPLLAGPVGTISCIMFLSCPPWEAEHKSLLHTATAHKAMAVKKQKRQQQWYLPRIPVP